MPVVDLAFASQEFVVSAVCQCGSPITRADLRVENFGTDANPQYRAVSCCSHDDFDAKTPDEIDLDRLWKWHVRLGIEAARKALEVRIEAMRNALTDVALDFQWTA